MPWKVRSSGFLLNARAPISLRRSFASRSVIAEPPSDSISKRAVGPITRSIWRTADSFICPRFASPPPPAISRTPPTRRAPPARPPARPRVREVDGALHAGRGAQELVGPAPASCAERRRPRPQRCARERALLADGPAGRAARGAAEDAREPGRDRAGQRDADLGGAAHEGAAGRRAGHDPGLERRLRDDGLGDRLAERPEAHGREPGVRGGLDPLRELPGEPLRAGLVALAQAAQEGRRVLRAARRRRGCSTFNF